MDVLDRELVKVLLKVKDTIINICLYGDIAEYDLSTIGLKDDCMDEEEWTRAHIAAAIAHYFEWGD